MSLKGKVAIVTGGGSGIGQAGCFLLSKEAATVAIGDVILDAANATATQIIEAGCQAMYGMLDVSDASSVEAFVGRVLGQYQRVDILVNNAGGIVTSTNVLDCRESDWDRTFALTYRSPPLF